MAIQPRKWQNLFIAKYTSSAAINFLLVACPGAGKTLAACFVIKDLLDEGVIERVIIVVPSATLREQWRKALASVGICVDAHTMNNEFGEMETLLGQRTQGWAVTYQSLAAAPLDHRRLNSEKRTLAVLDEVHHLSMDDKTAWGTSATTALGPCVRRLVLSGTPFRSDKTPIPFVEYIETPDGGLECRYRDDPDGTPFPNGFDYSYGVALVDEPSPVRPVVFDYFDGDVEWMDWSAKKAVRVRVSDEITDKKKRSAANRHVLNPAGGWLSTVLQAADDRITMVREEGDRTAKGVVWCKDREHALAITELLKGITEGQVYTAVSEDEFGRSIAEEAQRVIESFGKGNGRWLVAVRMVTEGIDIPELRVGVYATTVRADLYFRQAVGRVVRRRDDLPENVDQTAYLFVPKEPTMLALADAVQREVTYALISSSEEDIDETERTGGGIEDDPDHLPLDPFRESTADENGILVPGKGIVAAEEARRIAQATGLPIGVVATVLAEMPRETAPTAEQPQSREKPVDRIRRRKNLLEQLIKNYVGLLMRRGEAEIGKDGNQDYGKTISRFKSGVYTDAGIYLPGMDKKERSKAYDRADLPAVEIAIELVTKLLAT